jgi:single-stranded-DNA-specific exonuclease
LSVTKCKEKLQYILHTGKQHGLQDVYEQIEDNVQLVIAPDSSSNDINELKKLSEKNIKVLVMDHHHTNEIYEDENVIVINNQICNYPNKDLSGAGVTWQICRAYDEYCDLNFAKDLIDLAALGILSDMESYTSIENRAIIKIGLENIKNPFMYYMCEKNKFSIDKMGGINYMSMAFYVTPYINACVRSGTMEEKNLIFKSMLQMYAFDKIQSNKRGHKGEKVNLIEEAIRVIGNVKARQTRLQDYTMELLEKKIKKEDMLKNSILIFKCQPGEVEKNLAGLVANKLMAKYQRPVMVLIYSKTKDDEEPVYRGSARNYGLSEIEDLRQVCENSGLTELAQGHNSAFGCNISSSKIDEFQNWFNKNFDKASSEPTYIVDFI